METNAITVVYKWTAKPGQLDALKSIYDGVTDAMKANEPGALEVQVYVSENENALYVRDVFADADRGRPIDRDLVVIVDVNQVSQAQVTRERPRF